METAESVRYRSMTISVLVHLALFLALYFLVMSTKIPPFGEAGGGGGVLVNIGYVDLASGDVQPLSENVTTEPQPVKEKVTSAKENEKIATQDFEESHPVVTAKKTAPKKTETKKTITVTETKPVVKEKTVDSHSLYKGKSNSSTSQGTSATGTGDQGDPTGDPNSKYYGKNGGGGTGTGPGTGSGIGSGKGDGIGDFNLTGRSIMRRPVVVDNSQETGKVIVEIVVDKNGNVTSTSIERGTTTSNAHLQQLALKAARETQFTASPKGQEIQRGTITFVFVVH
jgi:TonB family protein